MSSAQQAFEDNKDEGADGLTKQQVPYALYDMGHNPTPIQIANFWKQHDKADDALLSVEELQQLFDSLGNANEALENAFGVFDINSDGTISKEELKAILATADVDGSGIADDNDMVDQIFNDADTNADGQLQISEFINMINTGAAGIGNNPYVED